MPDTPDLTQLQATYDHAAAQLTAYVTRIETAHREQHPDPLRADGTTRWDVDQAALRTAAWTDEERAELRQLRENSREAVVALHRAREGAANS